MTRWVPEEHGLVLAVVDQGVGIAPQHLARLCDPFFTTKAARGGTGLGLAIARDIARSHGGEITLSESPMGGLRATVRVPV